VENSAYIELLIEQVKNYLLQLKQRSPERAGVYARFRDYYLPAPDLEPKEKEELFYVEILKPAFKRFKDDMNEEDYVADNDDQQDNPDQTRQVTKRNRSPKNSQSRSRVKSLPTPAPKSSAKKSLPKKQDSGKEKSPSKKPALPTLKSAVIETPPTGPVTPLSDNKVAENITPNNVVFNNVLSGNIASDDITANNKVPNNIAHGNVTSDHIASDNIVSENTVSDNIPSDNLVSDNIASDNVVSDDIGKMAHEQSANASVTDGKTGNSTENNKGESTQSKKNASTVGAQPEVKTVLTGWGNFVNEVGRYVKENILLVIGVCFVVASVGYLIFKSHSTPPISAVERAVNYYKDKKYPEAANALDSLAANKSQPYLDSLSNVLYTEGDSCYERRQYEAAFHLVSKSESIAANPNAELLLGQMYDNGNDYVNQSDSFATEWYQKAANMKNEYAKYYLCLLDIKEARFRKGAFDEGYHGLQNLLTSNNDEVSALAEKKLRSLSGQ